jgi:AcrR family transcriptional regulator
VVGRPNIERQQANERLLVMRRSGTKKDGARSNRVGRPPRLSRELIVKAGVEFLRNNRDTPLTMARVAQAAGATPMAIYRHLKDRTDLLSSVVEQVLGELEHEIPADADWRGQVRAWMAGVHDHLMQFPQCMTLLGTDAAMSLAWLRSTATLIEILERTGLTGEPLVEATFWVSTSTMGYVHIALAQPHSVQLAALRGALRLYDDDRLVGLKPLARYIELVFKRSFVVVVERTIVALDALVESTANQPRPGLRRKSSKG